MTKSKVKKTGEGEEWGQGDPEYKDRCLPEYKDRCLPVPLPWWFKYSVDELDWKS